jgi:protein TonB
MRRSFTLVSVITHAIAIAAALVAQAVAVGPLPVPREPIGFVGAIPIIVTDVSLPRPARRSSTVPSDASRNVAPIEPPSQIVAESVHEPASQPIGGIVDGGVDLGGRLEALVLPPPPPPPPPPQQPMRLHSGMQAPRKVFNVDPIYPRIAESAHIGGVVILEAVIDARGRVESVRVLRSLPLLDQAAVDAVKQWIFTPALVNGTPVPVVMTVTVNFELGR